ncbi:hypothetical protein N7447_003178 [Penicillium robsamsonii]|uniref:uncharacterized protein n=1 Tax=Penicillium robsamsonii TaxID=1792511 RepID=UPI002547F1A5|nr:uncharacterized protein N7447_003178 [Penicillium robsamsonii]KAJ5837152.1 hypothetical protein N7447_003178 [Penicillium robsamsonii]
MANCSTLKPSGSDFTVDFNFQDSVCIPRATTETIPLMVKSGLVSSFEDPEISNLLSSVPRIQAD